MAQAKTLRHHTLRNTALPYVSNRSVTDEARPCFVDGSNILTSVRGYVEKRPGFAQYLSISGLASVQRVYTWERWNGDIYLLLVDITATTSSLYKVKVYSGTGGATETTPYVIYTDTASADPFDIAISNDTLFFTNTSVTWKYKPAGTGLGAVPITDRSPVGLGVAPAAPTVPQSAGTLTATVGYKYAVAYGNSVTGHIGAVSSASADTGAFANKTITVTGTGSSADAQIDKVHIYRTTDGGGGIYFEITGSPIAYPGNGVGWTLADQTADTALSSVHAPVSGINSSPSTTVGLNGIVWFANRLWAYRNNTVYFSGWEEILVGVEEEAWPDGNTFVFPSAVKGLGVTRDAVLVFLTTGIYKIAGDSLDTFTRAPLFEKMGAVNRACIKSFAGMVAWLDTADVVRITDGYTQEELSTDIRPDLQGIAHTTASLEYHSDGQTHWLLLADSAQNELWIYDLDTHQWMPAWTVDATALHSGVSAPGVYSLFAGSDSTNGGRVTKMSECLFVDDAEQTSTQYSGFVRTCLVPLVPNSQPGRLGYLEYIMTEEECVSPTFVSQVTDDDPVRAALVNLTANKVNGPPLRTAGTYLIEHWWYSNTPGCRRVATDVSWAAGTSNFKLYTLGFSFQEVT